MISGRKWNITFITVKMDANRGCITDRSPHVIPYTAVIATNPTITYMTALKSCIVAPQHCATAGNLI